VVAYTRREFGLLTLAGVPALVLGRSDSLFGALAQAKPNSLVDGVQLGAITYSYRSMPDQSAEATLKYVVDSGISGIELMGGPVESFAGAPAGPGRGGGGRGPGGGGRGPVVRVLRPLQPLQQGAELRPRPERQLLSAHGMASRVRRDAADPVVHRVGPADRVAAVVPR
jgi:hypothetical protein